MPILPPHTACRPRSARLVLKVAGYAAIGFLRIRAYRSQNKFHTNRDALDLSILIVTYTMLGFGLNIAIR